MMQRKDSKYYKNEKDIQRYSEVNQKIPLCSLNSRMPDGDAHASYPAYNGIAPVGRTRRARRHPALAITVTAAVGTPGSPS
ncbi:hypothetical protein L2E22_25005, partial [Salmonella enterica subsp. enterica serovar Weltevreden]|uniref:hypothetical protein n=1 Tax=Salmonella enterica TaxID=28901 RepID=UPI001F32CEEF